MLSFVALPQGQAFVQEALQRPEIAANVSDANIGGLLRLVLQVRVGTPWTYLLLAVLLAWVIGAVVVILRSHSCRDVAWWDVRPRACNVSAGGENGYR